MFLPKIVVQIDVPKTSLLRRVCQDEFAKTSLRRRFQIDVTKLEFVKTRLGEDQATRCVRENCAFFSRCIITYDGKSDIDILDENIINFQHQKYLKQYFHGEAQDDALTSQK